MLMNGKWLEVYESLGSTNNRAMEAARLGALGHGDAVLSRVQTSGKGQRGNAWHSGPNEGLLVSWIWEPLPHSAALDWPVRFQWATSLWVLQVLQGALNQGPTPQLKWPNDVYVGSNKLAGMLIEIQWQQQRPNLGVFGLGLNLNQRQFSPDLSSAISLCGLGMPWVDPLEAFQWFQHTLPEGLDHWLHLPKDQLKEVYQGKLLGWNEWCPFEKDGRKMEARLLGVNDQNQLLLETRKGLRLTCDVKSIRMLIDLP
jgi:BirA family transcriptional regulator, biotin operon repressor / biotin---[acetyl-CoA-carboxylase] ligase